MKKYYFVGKRPDEITTAPFMYVDESDAWDDLMGFSKDSGYVIFEVTVVEAKIGRKPENAGN